MIIPLDRLLVYNKNKYVFTKAVMKAVDKVGNIDKYPEADLNWKVVPNVLKMALTEEIKFDYVEKDGSLVLIVGFDGADGERFVTPIQIPLFYLEGDLNAHFYFMQYHSDKAYAVRTADITQRDTARLHKELYNLIGKCIAFAPARIALSGSQYGYSGAVFKYFDEHNAKLGLAEKLMLSVNTNKEHIAVAITFPQLYDVIDSFDEDALESWTIPQITQLDDIGRFSLFSVPMIDPIIYYAK